MARSDAALVAADGKLILTGDLASVLSTAGSNLLSIRIPRSALPPASSLDIVLLSASDEVLAAAPMSMVQNDWAAFFRSPSNSFATFGGFPTTLLDFSYLALGQPNVMFEVGLLTVISEARLQYLQWALFIGRQNLENLVFTSGGDPRILAQDLTFVPEPTVPALVAIGSLGLVLC